MAGSVNLKRFYVLLGVLAVFGGAAIALVGRSKSSSSAVRAATPVVGGATTAEPMPGYVIGDASAPVEVTEYADFQCPACRVFTILTMPDVAERLVKTGRVRWRFRDFPLPGHDRSPLAHHAAACAGEQDKFWPMHDQLYAHQDDWITGRTERKLRELARTAGVDVGRYDDCMDSKRFEARLVASREQAAAAGVQSTPTFVIGGAQFSGTIPYDRLKAVIDSVAAAAPASQPARAK